MARIREGWIKLYRSLGDNDMTGDGNLRHVWIQLLLDANIDSSEIRWNGKLRTLERGQVKLALRSYAKTLKLSRMTLHRKLQYLSETGRATIETGTEGMVITILKYEEKQSVKTEHGTIVGHGRDKGGTRVGQPWDNHGTHNKELRIKNEESKNEELNIPPAVPPGVPELEVVHVTVEKPKRVRKAPEVNPESTPGSYVFYAYSRLYEERYKQKPVRDQQANTICKGIAASLPREEINLFMECYFKNANSFYSQNHWPLALAKKDLHKIRTEMLTGLKVSTTQARSMERDQNNADVLNRWLDKQTKGQGNANP